MQNAKPIALSDLPQHSLWPARLLGLAPWEDVRRDHAKVDQEYNLGNYKKCLDFFDHAAHKPSLQEVRRQEFGEVSTALSSRGDDLVLMDFWESYQAYYDLIAASVLPRAKGARTILELGCGYGYNLDMLRERAQGFAYCGGEFSPNAVALAGKLFKGDIKVEPLDLYAAAYPVLEAAEGPVVIYTAHAIEQIPDISNLFVVLVKHKDKIQEVIHCEPVQGLQGDSLLGLLRRSYTNACDYNRNLIEELRRRDDIEILEATPNVFGVNAFNATSVIRWRFK